MLLNYQKNHFFFSDDILSISFSDDSEGFLGLFSSLVGSFWEGFSGKKLGGLKKGIVWAWGT